MSVQGSISSSQQPLSRQKLSAEQVDRYHQDGAVFPIPVFASEEVADFRCALESLEVKYLQEPLKRIDCLHFFFDWAYRLVTHEAVLDTVEGIIGDDILIDGTLVFCKPAQDKGFVSWHQDSLNSKWHLSPSTSAWIALTDSYPENGCMRIIPGSHQYGALSHITLPSEDNLLQQGQRVNRVLDESQALDMVLKPGEMSLHHPNVIHGSNPNLASQRRIGFIIRFVTNQTLDPGRPLLRVRGHGDCSHLRLADPQIRQNEQDAFLEWQRSNADYSVILG